MLTKQRILAAMLALAAGLAHAGANQVSLALEFERVEPVMAGISHVQRNEKQVLLDLDKKTTLVLDNGWVVELTGKDSVNAVDLALTIRDSAQAGAKVVAQPRILAKLGETTKVSWTSGEEKMSLAIKPAKPADK